MGRKPLPTKLKLIKGTLQKCRTNPREPKPKQEIPDPPKFLTGDALECWHRTTKVLHGMGVMTVADVDAVATYCDLYSRWRHYCRELDKLESPFILTDKGNLIQHPAIGASNKALQLMTKLMAEFGVTPASRGKVSGKTGETKTGWEEFA